MEINEAKMMSSKPSKTFYSRVDRGVKSAGWSKDKEGSYLNKSGDLMFIISFPEKDEVVGEFIGKNNGSSGWDTYNVSVLFAEDEREDEIGDDFVSKASSVLKRLVNAKDPVEESVCSSSLLAEMYNKNKGEILSESFEESEISTLLPVDEYGVKVQMSSTKGKTKFMTFGPELYRVLQKMHKKLYRAESKE